MKRCWAPCVVLLLLALPLAAQQSSESSPQRKCLVKGTVRFAGSNLPLRRAVVVLESAGKKPRHTRSDSQGRFELTDLDPGRYLFRVRSPGHRLQRVHIGFRQVPGDGPLPLSLSPGQRIADIVAYFLPPAVISGRILDAEGEPMDGVSVELVRVSRGSRVRWNAAVGMADTNDLGEFRISGLSAGTYYLRATPLGENARAAPPADAPSEAEAEPLVYAPAYYPGVTDRKLAAPLALRAGDELAVELWLRPLRAVRVRGRVVGIPGGGSLRLNVELRRNDGSMAMLATMTRPEDGAFEFEAVAPGSYVVRALAPPPMGPAGDPEDRFFRSVASQHLEVEAADVEGVSLVLTPYGRTAVPGRARFSGGVGTRLTRIVVRLEPEEEEEDELRVPPQEAVSAAVQITGSFELKNVHDGRYAVAFSVRGSREDENLYLKAATVAGEDVLEEGVLVSEGRVGGRLELLISSDGARIEGAVIDRSTARGAGAQLIAVPEKLARRRTDTQTQTADQDGRFQFRDLAPGDYKLYAWERAHEEEFDAQDPKVLKKYEDQAATVNVRERDRKLVELKVIKPVELPQ